ncbi:MULTISPECIES: GNAT family acetyltransferase [Rhodomicrobium]|uniref:GNAT family acetyltransferase n=1 Tax=Rhodomicrobium TaxID=1068 RepID=UPI001AECE091|nr:MULTISPECIES: GNAT family acetyltransferase [Rhodomicrobium]
MTSTVLPAITRFAETDRADLIALWEVCGLIRPWNDPDKDIDRKLGDAAGLFLVARQDGVLIGSAMAGYDGHRGSVNYLAVHPDHRHTGLGRRFMAEIEAALTAWGCPKINLMVRRSNTDVTHFYEKLGYQQDDVVVLGKRLISDL